MPTGFDVHPNLQSSFASLVETHRPELIKAAVQGPNLQADLLAVNDLIAKIKGKDPGTVAAWGLGCGGVCRSASSMADNPGFERRD